MSWLREVVRLPGLASSNPMASCFFRSGDGWFGVRFGLTGSACVDHEYHVTVARVMTMLAMLTFVFILLLDGWACGNGAPG